MLCHIGLDVAKAGLRAFGGCRTRRCSLLDEGKTVPVGLEHAVMAADTVVAWNDEQHGIRILGARAIAAAAIAGAVERIDRSTRIVGRPAGWCIS